MEAGVYKVSNGIQISIYMIIFLNKMIVFKKKENSNTRKLRKTFRTPGENRTHDPLSSSSDALTPELLKL